MRPHRSTRRQFLAACGLAPFTLVGCGKSSDKEGAEEAAREEAAREEKRIAQDLKQISVAMHNHHSALRGFPTAGLCVPPPMGAKPPLVDFRPAVPLTPVEKAILPPQTTHWRVALLPYLEQDVLYKRILAGEFGKEYWASPELLAACPKLYAAGSGDEATRTRYRVFVGNGALFAPGELPRIANVVDGVSNTLLVVEAEEAGPWTTPDDLVYDPKKPLPKLGHPSRDGFFALMLDGSVRYFPKNLDEKVLRKLITRAGGEVIDPMPGRVVS
jgi:hypothetical protein